VITSLSNASIKDIRRLVRDRKSRRESGQFYIEGLRIVSEALHQHAQIETLIYAPQLLVSSYGQDLIQDAADRGLALLEVSEEVFRSFALKDGPQGIAALVKPHWSTLDAVILKENDLWTALYQVADPGNLGTILRTMDAVGGQGVILLDLSTDPFDPSAVRASMGAIFSQKLVHVSFDEFQTWKNANSIKVVGTSDAAANDYHGYSYPSSLILLMGSERQGLPPEYVSICDGLVSIPMLGVSDSLNLSVAAGIVLYEILNQRRDAGKARERTL
jgi:TrmH family RNA methyltransferase